MSHLAHATIRRSVPVLLGLAVAVAACDVPEEAVEAHRSARVTPSTINVGHVQRVDARDQRCTSYTCKRYYNLKCVEWNYSCSNQHWGEKLYASATDQARDQTFPVSVTALPQTDGSFPPYSYPGELWQYRGCGPQAALNVLSYFGVTLSLQYVASQIDTINVPFSSSIATKPDRLRDGLQSLLNRYAVGRFRVTRTTGTETDVANALSRTKNPAIILANNGSHYLTVTGYSDSSTTTSDGINVLLTPWYFNVIDYPSNGTFIKRAPDLGMTFSGLPSWASLIPIGTGGHQSNTYITVDRQGDFLESGQSLWANGSISSPDGRFKLLHQTDGNLVLYRWDGAALWASNTFTGYQTYMQADGNLVTYDSSWNPVWSSNTWGWWGSYLRVQNDGNLVIYTPQGQAIWSTGTWGY